MKTKFFSVLLATVLLATGLGFADDAATSGGTRKTKEKIPLVPLNGDDTIVMVGGALILISPGGEVSRVEAELILPNGTRVLPDGSIVFRDGRTAMLKNGFMLSPSGEIAVAPEILFGRAKGRAATQTPP